MSDSKSSVTLLQSIERLFSKHRLERYQQPNASELSIISTYLWNIQLCEALFPALDMVETALRNSLHNHLSNTFQREDWYQVQGLLLSRQVAATEDAIAKIRRSQKPVTPGRVVAAMSLGFWVELLSAGNGYTPGRRFWIWDPKGHALGKTFPFASKQDISSRKRIHVAFRELRDLRNRVFHFECVYDDPALMQKHRQMVRMVEWIEPDVHLLVGVIDRFQESYRAGPKRTEHLLRHLIFSHEA